MVLQACRLQNSKKLKKGKKNKRNKQTNKKTTLKKDQLSQYKKAR